MFFRDSRGKDEYRLQQILKHPIKIPIRCTARCTSSSSFVGRGQLTFTAGWELGKREHGTPASIYKVSYLCGQLMNNHYKGWRKKLAFFRGNKFKI